jgi:hypothetical protein
MKFTILFVVILSSSNSFAKYIEFNLKATCQTENASRTAIVVLKGPRATVSEGTRRADLFQISETVRMGGVELGFTERLNGGGRINVVHGAKMKSYISSVFVNSPSLNGVTYTKCIPAL